MVATLNALVPAGRDADAIASLFWWMAAVSAVVWIAAMALLVYCLRVSGTDRPRPSPSRLIVWAGLVIPLVLLTAWLVRALPHIERLVDAPPRDDRAWRIHVHGEQWWWRVRYEGPDGRVVDTANELRLPRGETSHLTFSSDDVIHAFWVPSLAGKVDVIPGRATYLTIEPTASGRFRGVCAEYCGASHARMHVEVVVVEPEAFARWLDAEAAPSAPPSTPRGREGAALFQTSGCGACHQVRGTPATGRLGPDLTHVSRRFNVATIAAALADDPLALWLRDPHAVKPGARMPPFAALGDAHVTALAAYLRELP